MAWVGGLAEWREGDTVFGPVSTTSYRFRLNEGEMRQRITEDRDVDEMRRALAVLGGEADFPWEEVIIDDSEQGKES